MAIESYCCRLKSEKSFLPIVAFLSLMIPLAFLESCKKKAVGWQGTMRAENGVVIVENPAEPLYKNASLILTEELSIGGPNADAESELIQVTSFDVDSAGNIYVLDGKACCIKKYGAKGRFVTTMGKKGQGPGEFQYPSIIRIVRQNELAVSDYQKNVIYSLDGRYLTDVPAPNSTNFSPMDMDSQSIAYGYQVIYETTPLMNLVRISPNLKSNRVLSGIVQDSEIKKEITVYAPYFVCAVNREDQLIWGVSNEYVINIMNSSGLQIRKISRKAKAVRLTLKEKEEEERDEREHMKGFPGYKLIIPDAYPFIGPISSDAEGRIIVQTYEKSDRRSSYLKDIFDSEGRYLAKIVIPAPIGRLRWKKDKLYGVTSDKEGYPVIKRYDVRWTFQ